MKKSSFALILLFFYSTLHAQWIPQNSGTTQTLRDIYFISSSTGFAVGENGVILKSTDGGMNWNTQASPTLSDLSAVKFVNASTGYITVQDTFFLRTSDGGTTWTIVQLDTIQENPGSCFYCMYNQVDFFDSANGLIVLSEGQLTKATTTNSGGQWELSTEGLSAAFTTAVSRPVKDSIYLLDVNRKLARSYDSGNNWSESSLASGSVFFYALDFVNGKTGYVAGERSSTNRSFINRTIDGGATWQQVLQDSLLKKRILSLDFDAGGSGLAVGNGVILTSLDHGNSWVCDSASFPAPGRLHGARITSAGKFAVGSNGTILRNQEGVGIPEVRGQGTGINVYPNPGRGDLVHVRLPDLSEPVEFRIYAHTGQEVVSTSLNSKESIIPLGLARGIYSYTVRSPKHFLSGKLVIDQR